MNHGYLRSFAPSFVLALSCVACHHPTAPALVAKVRSSPAPPNSLVPQLTRLSDGRFALSWQKKLESGGYAFAMAMANGDRWSEVRIIDSGPNLSMFTADLPGIAEISAGTLLAYWELKDTDSDDRYATKIQTAVSSDEGRTWQSVHQPYPDALAGQHSFLSWFPLPNRGIGLAWLDEQQRSIIRETVKTTHAAHELGAIGLRYATLGSHGETLSDAFIVPITCECCPTAAAKTTNGPVVVYRGRVDPAGTKPSEVDTDRPTVRDIYLTRLEHGSWTTPHRVHADDWVINACPDNGPAVDASGNHIAVAWWAGAQNTPKVQIAFSDDAGDSFGKSIRVDASHGEGQVTVAIVPGSNPPGAVVGWLEDNQVRARVVSRSGTVGPITVLGPSPRHSRLPRWYASGNQLLAVWTEKTVSGPQVKVSQLEIQN